jgi:hypothetical protein
MTDENTPSLSRIGGGGGPPIITQGGVIGQSSTERQSIVILKPSSTTNIQDDLKLPPQITSKSSKVLNEQ